MRWSRAAAARVAAEQREHEVAADQLGLEELEGLAKHHPEWGDREELVDAVTDQVRQTDSPTDMAPYAQADLPAIDPEAQAEGQTALEDLARHRHDMVFDFGKGWVVAITDTGEQFHMWIDQVELTDGSVTVNGVMRPVTDIPYTIVGYEVYGEDGSVIVRRPAVPNLQFTPSEGDKQAVQNMLIRWTIQEQESAG